MACGTGNGLCRAPKVYRLGPGKTHSGPARHLARDSVRKGSRRRIIRVFIGLVDLWNMPIILQHRRLINEGEADDIYEHMSRKVNPETILMEYVRRAYFDSRKASNFLH